MIHGRLINEFLEADHPAAHRFDVAARQTPQTLPWTAELWLPEPFEPRYAYPLLVWLHDDGEDELADANIADAAAAQNMIVMSVRAPHVSGDGFDWSPTKADVDGASVWSVVSEELACLPAELNLHPQRFFVAGRGAGAVAAWRAWIANSDRIAGAALVQPPHTPDCDSLRQAALTSQKQPALNGRLWIGGSATTSWRSTARSAYALGAEVSLDPTANTAIQVGRSLDRWVMRALPTAVFA